MSKVPVSPYSTGGGGTTFEQSVASYYMVDLLLDRVPRGSNIGPVRVVRLQQRNRGKVVDDIVLSLGEELGELALQAKHRIRFAPSDPEFVDALKQCWEHHRGATFDPDVDRVGIATSEVSSIQRIRQALPTVIDYARTSVDAGAFVAKSRCLKGIKAVYSDIRKGLKNATGVSMSDRDFWRFLRVFVVEFFDFETPGARDTVYIQNSLRTVVPNSDSQEALTLSRLIGREAADFAKAGGEFTRESLLRRLSPDVQQRVSFVIGNGRESVRDRMRTQVKSELGFQEQQGRYLPELFTESPDAKDKARYFCLPALFWRKELDELLRIDTGGADRWFAKLGLHPVGRLLPATVDCGGIHPGRGV